MTHDSPLSLLPKTMADAAFDGDTQEVLRLATSWLRRFTGASYVILATSQEGPLWGDFRAGVTPEYAVKLAALPLGRGTIYGDDKDDPRAIYAGDRRPSFAMPGQARAHFLSLPVYANHEAVAITYISRPTRLGEYTWREQLCVCGYVVQIGAAVEIAESARRPDILKLRDAQEFLEANDEARSFLRFTKSSLEDTLEQTAFELSALSNVDAAHVYLPAPDGLLVPTNLWRSSSTRRFQSFQRATEHNIFTAGRGLPGRVLKSKRSAWIRDITADGNFPRVHDAEPVGIRSAVAFPVRHQERVAAVVECFFTEEIQATSAGIIQHIEELLTI